MFWFVAFYPEDGGDEDDKGDDDTVVAIVFELREEEHCAAIIGIFEPCRWRLNILFIKEKP